MTKSKEELQRENRRLRSQVEEMEETLQAIRDGEVDAIVVDGARGENIYSLSSAETTYRFLIEEMSEGAAILSEEGIVLYCNESLAGMIGESIHSVAGSNFYEFLEDGTQESKFKKLLDEGSEKPTREDFNFHRGVNGDYTHLILSVAPFNHQGEFGSVTPDKDVGQVSLIASDITDHKEMERRLRDYKNNLEEKVAERTEELLDREEKLEESFIRLAETTSRVLGVRDPYTEEHELRVAELAREVGRRMGLDEDRLLGLYLGGILHDIGKIAIPETILTKPGELEDIEWELIKSHPEVGYNKILKQTDFPWPVAEMTLHHHERLDGSGYPDGLKGDEISPEVRILGAVDVVEAMSTRRPYRKPRTKGDVLDEITSGRGIKYDPEVVDILVEMIESGDVNFDRQVGSTGEDD